MTLGRALLNSGDLDAAAAAMGEWAVSRENEHTHAAARP